MLDRLRGTLDSALARLGAVAARAISNPTAWTLLGLAVSLLAAYFYSTAGRLGGPVAGILVLVSGFLDVVDGSVARATNRVSRRGSFLDSTLDRVGEVALYLGILVGGYAPPFWLLLALALSLLVSYARAKAESLGVGLAGIGVGERSERLIVLALSSLLGYVLYGVLAVLLLAGATFLERVYRVSTTLR